MAKSRSRNDVEYLRGEIRHLKKHIKSLQKQLTRANKPVIESGDQPDDPAPDDTLKCPKCHLKLNTVDMGKRSMLYCKNCSYRKVSKLDGDA